VGHITLEEYTLFEKYRSEEDRMRDEMEKNGEHDLFEGEEEEDEDEGEGEMSKEELEQEEKELNEFERKNELGEFE
jgi:hypothetical protein